MAAVLEQKPDPAAKFGSQVDEQIAQATTRIRTHDLTLGALTLAALTAGYAAAMISLDRYLNLPEWVRQLSLAGFLAVLAAAAYFLIARPLRRRINPLYAAARVEDTIEDAKNSVTGYVEAQETGRVSPGVKAAMSARAARAVGEADVNQAVDNRRLVVAGGVLVVLLIGLAVLFFVFRPAQFASLVGRTFAPFSSDPIATRTQLDLVRPDPADPTISAGQTVTVAVRVGGKVPPASAPDRVRLLIRHNPADPTYDELPMQEGETTRDWQLKVPEYLVQNGFWYKVAAGDAETAEHKVTVRSLPLFTEYEAKYEYPAYTRLPAAKGTDPNLRAYRGTKVTLTARANRDVASGAMKFEAAALKPVPGAAVADRPDALRFKFTATEPTRYRLHLTAATGEKNVDPPAFAILIDSDQPPRVEITKPEEPESTTPANGQLAVDGTIGDDFGIDKYRLRLKVGDRDLAPVYPGDGKPASLRREKDGTWPTDLSASGGFKLSADLPKLEYADGTKFEPKEGDTVEYWVEAIDNCAEAKPVEGWGAAPQAGNVGRSDPRRLRLTAPQIEPEQKDQLDRRRERRQSEEKQHQAQQQQKLDDENRPPPQPQDGQPQPEQKNGEAGDAKKDTKAEGGKDGEAKKDSTDPNAGTKDATTPKAKDGTPPDPQGKTPPDGGDAAKMPPEGMGGKKEGDPAPKAGADPKSPDKVDPKGGTDPAGMGGMNNADPPPTAPPPKSPDDAQAERDADRVQNELNKNKGDGGNAKPDPTTRPEDRTEPAKSKPEPKDGNGSAAPKDADPKANQPGGKEQPSESKPAGNLEKPADPAEAKPQPKADGKGDQAESRDAPLGGNPGTDKPEPQEPKKDTNPPAKESDAARQDQKSGSAAKPSTAQPGGESGDPKEKDESAAEAGTAKPPPEATRGTDKTPARANGGQPPKDEKPKEDLKAAGAKPEKAPDNAASKPAPQPDPTGAKQTDASETKSAPPEPKSGQPGGGASEAKPAPPEPKDGAGAAGAEKATERGADKPSPKDGEGRPQGGSPDAKQKDKGGATGGDPRELDPKEQKELEDAAKDLTSPDPQKREAAQKKLDGKIGEKNRKELEKLADDQQSGDKEKQAAAQQKLEEMKKKAAEEQAKQKGEAVGKKEGGGEKGVADKKAEAKLTPEQRREAEDAADDLTDPDPAKQQAARDKLDKLVGPENRKAVEEAAKREQAEREKLEKDLKSDDKATREAAEQKVREALKRAEEEAKKGDENGKLTPEQVEELTKLARDLDSADEEKRKAAEQAIDRQLGKDVRRRLQKVVKGYDAPKPAAKPADADPRHKAKTAQLQLEQFEKNRYNKDLHDSLGWTREKYEDFLKAAALRAEQLAKEADRAEEVARTAPPAPGVPTIKTGGADTFKGIEGRSGATSAAGAGVAPAGFDGARNRFEEELKKPKP